MPKYTLFNRLTSGLLPDLPEDFSLTHKKNHLVIVHLPMVAAKTFVDGELELAQDAEHHISVFHPDSEVDRAYAGEYHYTTSFNHGQFTFHVYFDHHDEIINVRLSQEEETLSMSSSLKEHVQQWAYQMVQPLMHRLRKSYAEEIQVLHHDEVESLRIVTVITFYFSIKLWHHL